MLLLDATLLVIGIPRQMPDMFMLAPTSLMLLKHLHRYRLPRRFIAIIWWLHHRLDLSDKYLDWCEFFRERCGSYVGLSSGAQSRHCM